MSKMSNYPFNVSLVGSFLNQWFIFGTIRKQNSKHKPHILAGDVARQGKSNLCCQSIVVKINRQMSIKPVQEAHLSQGHLCHTEYSEPRKKIIGSFFFH